MNIFDINTAKVEVFGINDTIANHLRFSKYFSDPNANENDFDYFIIQGKKLPKEYFLDFEKMLWCKYFKIHQEINQEFIPENLKDSINFLKTEEGKEFSNILKSKEDLIVLEKDIFTSKQNIICHQVNCQGVMGRGIAATIKENYITCFEKYKILCEKHANKEELHGQCQIVKIGENKYIANLFGQLTYGKSGCYTDYNALKNAFLNVKERAKKNKLSVCIPYGIGSSLAGGDWNIVSQIIKEVFVDYPVIIYKLPQK